MTRAEQNALIIAPLQQQLGDMPNVEYVIGKTFNAWFQQLVQQGLQILNPPPPEATQEEDEQQPATA